MPAYVWTALTFVSAVVSFWNLWRVRKAHKTLKKDPILEFFGEFYEWGAGTKVVVRDKLSHEFVTDIRVLDLFTLFHTGQVFENAKMLWQNDDFKVFVAGPRPKKED